MKTIICDVDGTLSDMWPIERTVLLRLLGREYLGKIEGFKSKGNSNTFYIFQKCVQRKVKKTDYYRLYNKAFSELLECRKLPPPEKYPLVSWIFNNSRNYIFVYVTGGQKSETLYVLERLGVLDFFDTENSIDKSNFRFSKRTGIPFRRILNKYPDCILLTDSESDCRGAAIEKIDSIRITKDQHDL